MQFLLDATLGLINLAQNDIIKLFSVLAVIFMPPTVIASIYGMNFKEMPELEWRYGYPLALCHDDLRGGAALRLLPLEEVAVVGTTGRAACWGNSSSIAPQRALEIYRDLGRRGSRQRVASFHADLHLQGDRAPLLQEVAAAQLAPATNKNLFVLTVVTTLLLPPAFVSRAL